MALGQLAAKRGDSSEVKKYGQALAREHQVADKQLLLLAKNKKVNLSTTGKGVSETLRTMKESVAYQNLKTLSGKKFDEEFLKTVKDEHRRTIDVLESASVTDEEVSKFADKQLVALREHLQKAEAISKD